LSSVTRALQRAPAPTKVAPEASPPRVLHLVMEATFARDRDGRYWCKELQGNDHWSLIAGTFDHVHLVARVVDTDELAPPAQTLDPARVTVVPLPAYKGLAGFLRVATTLVARQWTASAAVDVALLRLPGPIGSIMGLCLAVRGKRHVVELVGDIDDVLTTAGFSAPTRATRVPLRWLTRRLCQTARAVSYVTQETLQRKYPSGAHAASCACSDVQLTPDDFARGPRRSVRRDVVRLAFCGSLAQRYKGADVLVEAVRLLRARGLRVEVQLAGDGVHRAALAQQAARAGVADSIHFLGHVSRERVMALFSEVDLFVMPSRTEGLPRALIEAMARGLPCIASRVGGIPELLADDALVPPDRPAALAEAIERFVTEPARMDQHAERNLAVARRFASPRLFAERMRFLHAIVGVDADALEVSGA
jgi:phosphatidyl-myo-inositol dimannoside synthase